MDAGDHNFDVKVPCTVVPEAVIEIVCVSVVVATFPVVMGTLPSKKT
jgi:hypothetical protein